MCARLAAQQRDRERPRVPLLPHGVTDAALAVTFPKPDPYLHDPTGWMRDELNEHAWSMQAAVCDSVVQHRYTAVPSSHDTGKSFIVSRLAAWWLKVHPPGEAFVVTTAPTDKQVKAILWREIGKAHAKGNLPGYVTQAAEWKMQMPDGHIELVGYGRKPADHDPAAFSGIHARYVLVIVDEAVGVPKALWDAIDSLATNVHARVVAIGNPDDPNTQFNEVCKPGSGWNVVHIDGCRSPNMTRAALEAYPRVASYFRSQGIEPSDEWVPDNVRDLLVSVQWIDERIVRWGPDSNVFQSKVRGRFPEVGEDTLITPTMLREACARDLPGFERGWAALDVARLGGAESVIYHNRGGHVRFRWAARKIDTTVTEQAVRDFIGDTHSMVPVWIDADGVGGPVYDHLVKEELPVHAHYGSMKALRPHRFTNRRSEIYWTARQMFIDGLLDIDEEDEDLIAQLGNIKWSETTDGRIRVETKEEMAARGVPSPDRADAFVMSLVKPPETKVVALDATSLLPVSGDLMNAPT